MADTNRTKLAFIAEEDFATAVSGSNLQTLRITGESLAQSAGSTQSGEIRSDRQVSSIRHSRIEAAGAINFELSYGTYDALLAAALLDSAWGAPVAVAPAATVSAVVSGNKFTGTFAAPTAGEWIKVSGFATAANNGYFKVVTASTSEITVSGGTLVNEADKAGVTIVQGGSIVNGTSLSTFNIERTYEDLDEELALFLGMGINTLSLNVPTEGMVTGSLGFMGSKETSRTASAGSGYDAASTTEPFTALDVSDLLENQASQSILAFTLNLNNNLRTRVVVGASGVASLGSGRVDLSGTLQVYFESKTLFDKYLNETASALAMVLADAAGNAMIFDLPQVKYTSGQRVATGPNGDVVADLGWGAYMDPTENVTFRIAKFPIA